MSYQLDQMVEGCSIGGHKCDKDSDFALVKDPKYGNCYTFNYKAPSYKSRRAGPSDGIALTLTVDSSEYVCSSDSSGFRVVINRQEENPFPDSEGYLLAPGTYTRIAMRQVRLLPYYFHLAFFKFWLAKNC